LFVGVAGKPKGFLTLNSAQDKKRVVPIFFDKEQLQVVLDKFKKDQPNLAATTEIQVITLDGLLTQMRAKNEAFYSQIVIASPREMTEYVQSRPPASTKPNTTKPETPVKPTTKKPR
jgi:Tic22-like family